MVDDNFESSELEPRHKAAVVFADAYLGTNGPPTGDARSFISAHFDGDEIAEMGIGMALFHGFSKLLIAVGAEPEEMDVTILRTPGSPRP